MTKRGTHIDRYDLPKRPRFLPGLEIFRRKEGEIQIGLDPRHGLVATGLEPHVIRFLRRLDGQRRLDALLARASNETIRKIRVVLHRLTENGMLEDARKTAGRPPAIDLWPLRTGQSRHEAITQRKRSVIVVHGDGKLAMTVATLLATTGIGHVHLRTNGRLTETEVGCWLAEDDLGTWRSAAAMKAINRANPATETGPPAYDRTPDLVILTDTFVPAPEIVHPLTQSGTPHLVVCVRDGLGIIGPLVIPGQTSCLRCADLRRTELDPCWPNLANQLAGRVQPASATNVHATAALAVEQVLRALGPADLPLPVWNGALEVDLFDGTVQHRSWPPHPRCGCRG